MCETYGESTEIRNGQSPVSEVLYSYSQSAFVCAKRDEEVRRW